MKRIIACLMLVLLAAPASLLAQTSSSTDASQSAAPADQPTAPVSPFVKTSRNTPPAPFSRLGLQAGIGLMGINMQAAVEANRHLNIRGIGNYFSYTVNNIKVSGGNGANGVNASASLNFATAGVALDYYPWPNHGFRLSPGVMLYNQNVISASGTSSPGNSITLNSTKYYADSVNPFLLNPRLGLNTHQQAFTATMGWGNLISRRGGHFSVPFEIGAVFTGVPTLALNITGNGCTNSADVATNGPSCVNMATNSNAQAAITAQIAKYQSDLNPLKVYPIVSLGFGFNFSIH
ncbi:MAG: hypothetical protein ABSB50_19175 [Terracidiphilus sp.]